VSEQDIAVMALTVDILNGVTKPEGNPTIIKSSMYALSRAAEFFGQKLYAVKLEVQGQSPIHGAKSERMGTVPASGEAQGQSPIHGAKSERMGTVPAIERMGTVPAMETVPVPFIAHLNGDHYILVTRISDDKVYFSDNHKEEFLPLDKFLEKFSGYALISTQDTRHKTQDTISDEEALSVKGAGNDYSGGGSMISGSWEDGANGGYNGGNYYVPVGYSTPQMPSFSSNNITPTYYFPQAMYVNSAGFTTPGGGFINPTGLAYTVGTGVALEHSTITWFHNGLDGIAVPHHSPYIAKMDQAFVQPLGLNNIVRVEGSNMPYTALDRYGNTYTDYRPVYRTATGFTLTDSTVLKQIGANEGLNNYITGTGAYPQQYRRNPDEPISLATATMGYHSTPDGYAVLYMDNAKDFIHWNYMAGAYVQPGDILYGKGQQSIHGFGTSAPAQQQVYAVNDSGSYQFRITAQGNLFGDPSLGDHGVITNFSTDSARTAQQGIFNWVASSRQAELVLWAKAGYAANNGWVRRWVLHLAGTGISG